MNCKTCGIEGHDSQGNKELCLTAVVARCQRMELQVEQLKKDVAYHERVCSPNDERLDAALLQVGELQKEVTDCRKMLWVLARNEGLSLKIPMTDLDTIPQQAELLTWHEPLFDSMMLKGLCQHADCAPSISAKPVHEKASTEKQKGPCPECGGMTPNLACPYCGSR